MRQSIAQSVSSSIETDITRPRDLGEHIDRREQIKLVAADYARRNGGDVFDLDQLVKAVQEAGIDFSDMKRPSTSIANVLMNTDEWERKEANRFQFKSTSASG